MKRPNDLTYAIVVHATALECFLFVKEHSISPEILDFLYYHTMNPGSRSAAKKRCEKEFGSNVSSKLLFRIHSGSESFKLTGSGKRDVKALLAEGVEQAIIIK